MHTSGGCRLGAELFPEQFVDLRGIGLALGGFHHLPEEIAEQRFLASTSVAGLHAPGLPIYINRLQYISRDAKQYRAQRQTQHDAEL